MPIKWTAELDAILLHGVFEECNISFGKGLCAKIAERVNAAGVEVSAKAIENRLYSWKKKNTSENTVLDNNTSATPKKLDTPKPKTPRSRKKATPKKRKASDSDSGPEGGLDNGDDNIKSPCIAREKRSMSTALAEPASESKSDNIHKNKRVKTEPSEDHEGSAE